MFKSGFQVALVTLEKTLKRNYKFIHAIVYFGLMGALFIFEIKVPAYNYNRVNLWERLSIAAVLWITFLAFFVENVLDDIDFP